MSPGVAFWRPVAWVRTSLGPRVVRSGTGRVSVSPRLRGVLPRTRRDSLHPRLRGVLSRTRRDSLHPRLRAVLLAVPVG